MDVLITATPDTEADVSVKPVVLSSEFSDGYVQTTAVGIFNTPQTDNPKWSNLDYATATSLIAFLKSQKGYKKFLWSPSEDIQRIYLCTDFKFKWKKGRRCDISATFVEQAG